MKSSCLILGALILIAIVVVCFMVKFATDIAVEQRKLDDYPSNGSQSVSITRSNLKDVGIISLSETSTQTSHKFPYLGAITRNISNSWTFQCFASVILISWVVTSAHCRQPGSTHRFVLYHDIAHNFSHTYKILYWKSHENYNITSNTETYGRYDIAVAKLNVDVHPLSINLSATFNEFAETEYLKASVWKTLATMDRKLYLTNEIDEYSVTIVPARKCYISYSRINIDEQYVHRYNNISNFFVDESVFCVDMTHYDDCFVQDFGPIFMRDKVVGVSAVIPRDCNFKLAIFTNVSYYTDWILKSTSTTWFI